MTTGTRAVGISEVEELSQGLQHSVAAIPGSQLREQRVEEFISVAQWLQPLHLDNETNSDRLGQILCSLCAVKQSWHERRAVRPEDLRYGPYVKYDVEERMASMRSKLLWSEADHRSMHKKFWDVFEQLQDIVTHCRSCGVRELLEPLLAMMEDVWPHLADHVKTTASADVHKRHGVWNRPPYRVAKEALPWPPGIEAAHISRPLPRSRPCDAATASSERNETYFQLDCLEMQLSNVNERLEAIELNQRQMIPLLLGQQPGDSEAPETIRPRDM